MELYTGAAGLKLFHDHIEKKYIPEKVIARKICDALWKKSTSVPEKISSYFQAKTMGNIIKEREMKLVYGVDPADDYSAITKIARNFFSNVTVPVDE